MGLLRRTLQTLLSKYLQDVDVEGVNLPSLYESGWGVRLRNVQLREGAVLMDLQKEEKAEESENTETVEKPSSWWSSSSSLNASEKFEPLEKERLCLQLNGGTIGTLDVRLVGNDIHVLIEDADIVVAVVHTTSEAEKEKAKKKKTSTSNTSAQNPLAKILSVLPNLFIRDLRVRMILLDGSELELTIEFLSITDGTDFWARIGESGDEVSINEEDEEEDKNSPFLTKRIRTGRGEHGGIVLYARPAAPPPKRWGAFERYQQATDDCMIRIPGLDISGRVALPNYDYEEEEDTFDEYSVDAMLFGIDSIAPPPPLPEIGAVPEQPNQNTWTYRDATNYQTDENGIQSSGVSSNFHRVARGRLPMMSNEMPCSQTKPQHPLDAALPLPGVVLHVGMRDVLECNLDLPRLEVIGTALQLFQSKQGEPDYLDASARSTDTALSRNNSMKSVSSEAQNEEDIYNPDVDDSDITHAFPAYMQPSYIQVIGLHLLEVRLRVQVRDFAYWDTCAKCVTMDLQSCQKVLQDVRLDVGHFQWREYAGAERKLLASLGLRKKVVEFDEMTVETMLTQAEEDHRPPWPSTAAALLNSPPPLETLAYEARDRHGVQIRYISVPKQHKQLFAARVGCMSIDAPWDVKQAIPQVIAKVRRTVLGPPPPPSPPNPSPEKSSVWQYQVRLDGGQLRLHPLLDISTPMTVATGEYSDQGLFIESLLDQIMFTFGRPSLPPTFFEDGTLSLSLLAGLPEQVRTRILLFLEDVKPLARALNASSRDNNIWRAVNQQIVRLARRHHSEKTDDDGGLTRRQELLSDILKLSDDALEDMWLEYQRTKRRNSRRR